MAGALHGLLDEDRGIAEGAFGFTHGGLEGVLEIRGLCHAAHAATAAAGDRLDEEGYSIDSASASNWAISAEGGWSRARDAGIACGAQCLDLVSGQFEHIGLRADEGDSGFGTGACQIGVLGEEAVAGVDGVGACFLRHPQHLFDAEVGADRVTLFTDHVGFVSLHAVFGIAVLIGEDCDCGGSELIGGTERTDGDLSAVGHENFREHRCLSLLYRPHWATVRQAVGNILYSVTWNTSATGGSLWTET